jgi:hypothetical protein
MLPCRPARARNRGERVRVPHPDDEADLRAGLEEAERGDVLSAEESAAYIRSLVGEEPLEK